MNSGHRQVVIATDASISLKSGFAESYRILVVPRRYRVGQQTILSAEGPIRFATDRTLPMLLPAQFDDFVEAYKQVGSTSIVSIHSPGTIDNAVQQARIARNVLSPTADIEIFETKTIDGGIQLLIETAANFINSEKDATKDQVLALLERIHSHILTVLLSKGIGQLPCEPKPHSFQELVNLFGPRRLFKMDTAKAIFRPVSPREQIQEVRIQKDQQVIVQWHHQHLTQANRLFSEMIAWLGQDAFQVREIYSKNPIFPSHFIALVTFPDPVRITELVKWVKRWGRATIMSNHKE